MKDKIRVTAKTPEDLINIAARVLGFWPQDSLVVLKFGDGSPQFRIDMPHTQEALDEVLTGISAVTPHFQDGRAVMLMFTDDVEMWRETAFGLLAMWPNVDWVDTLRVHEDHFWHLAAPDEPFPYTEHGFPGWDQTPARSREERAEEIRNARCSEEFTAALAREHATVRMYPLRGLAQWVVDTFTDRVDEAFTDDELALLVANLQAHGVVMRDVISTQLTRDHTAIMLDAVKRCGPNAHMRALLALTAWLAGDGALAWIAVDLARDIEPDNSLCDLLDIVLTNAIPPSTWAPPSAEDLPAFREE